MLIQHIVYTHTAADSVEWVFLFVILLTFDVQMFYRLPDIPRAEDAAPEGAPW